jgi:drug/metabolite transporter (DMT)-like permease
MKNMSHWFLLSIVLIAFAANSILCRLALKLSSGSDSLLIDPASFTAIRLISGALMLMVLLFFSDKKIQKPSMFHFKGAVFLFLYAVTFSFAYIALDAAMGALILFGVVQICIISISVIRGNRLSVIEWLGCAMAVMGLLVLTLPHLLQQSALQGQQVSLVIPVILMIVSGVAWGLFTVNGAGSKDSLLDTASCFILTIPVVLILAILVFIFQDLNITTYGFILAVMSGALASGMGYALWYNILPKLTSSQASTSQLLVPIIAALGGSLFLNESLTLNFLIATVLTLGGVLMVIKASVKKKI